MIKTQIYPRDSCFICVSVVVIYVFIMRVVVLQENFKVMFLNIIIT